MNDKERDVLYSLCNGEISFAEAAIMLGISKEKVEELLDNYTWTPSLEKLSELHEIEMENYFYIKSQVRKEKIFEHLQSKGELTLYIGIAKQFLISAKKITTQ